MYSINNALSFTFLEVKQRRNKIQGRISVLAKMQVPLVYSQIN